MLYVLFLSGIMSLIFDAMLYSPSSLNTASRSSHVGNGFICIQDLIETSIPLWLLCCPHTLDSALNLSSNDLLQDSEWSCCNICGKSETSVCKKNLSELINLVRRELIMPLLSFTQWCWSPRYDGSNLTTKQVSNWKNMDIMKCMST